MDVFEEAVCFAVRAHDGALRKGSHLPYIIHPLEAAAIVATMTDDREVLAAVVLHDVLEDTDVTEELICAAFGQRVAMLVAKNSENKRPEGVAKDTWLIRKRETVEALIAETDESVKMIALGDKLSNIRATSRDSAVIGQDFWNRFNVKDPALHGWYYNAVADALETLVQFPAWQEYRMLVDTVFGACRLTEIVV